VTPGGSGRRDRAMAPADSSHCVRVVASANGLGGAARNQAAWRSIGGIEQSNREQMDLPAPRCNATESVLAVLAQLLYFNGVTVRALSCTVHHRTDLRIEGDNRRETQQKRSLGARGLPTSCSRACGPCKRANERLLLSTNFTNSMTPLDLDLQPAMMRMLVDTGQTAKPTSRHSRSVRLKLLARILSSVKVLNVRDISGRLGCRPTQVHRRHCRHCPAA